MMQTVMMGIMIGLFPIMVMAAMFNMMTMQVLKGTFCPDVAAVVASAVRHPEQRDGVLCEAKWRTGGPL
jgi:hypothetical protein